MCSECGATPRPFLPFYVTSRGSESRSRRRYACGKVHRPWQLHREQLVMFMRACLGDIGALLDEPRIRVGVIAPHARK